MATYASDGTQPDVQAKMNQATGPGDKVTVPSGTFIWTSGVEWTAPVGAQLIGAGTTAIGGGNQTIIQDNIAGGQRLIQIYLAATGLFRMSGITVQSGTGGYKDGGTVSIHNEGKIRIDHCRLNSTAAPNYKMVAFWSGVRGVMDRCILDFIGTNSLYFYNAIGGGSGDTEWTRATAFGTDDYFYIEDCNVNGDAGGTYSTRVWDGFTGAKVVVRFNTVVQAVLAETHDTGHSSDDRGTRSMEIYGNSVTSSLAQDPNFCAVAIGNGTALVFGNSWNNVYKNIYRTNVTRKNNTTYTQAATPTSWGYAGTAFNGTGSNWDGGTINATNTATGYPAIDQPGRGAGQLLVGSFPAKTNNVTGTIAWPNQALEPLYFWNNTGGIVSGWGGAVDANDTGGRCASDRDYYLPAAGIQTTASSPFNGTTGTGWGTLANRPTTCTAGVGYWATDVGSWNKSVTNPCGVQQNGAAGTLYKCTSANVWTEYYAPYEYPHPLRDVAAGPSTPQPRRRSGFGSGFGLI